MSAQVFTHTCEIDEDFLDRNFKASHDGIFSFRLENMEMIDMDKVSKVRVEFEGSNIPFEYGDKLDINSDVFCQVFFTLFLDALALFCLSR